MYVRSKDPSDNNHFGIWTDDILKQAYTESLTNALSNNSLHSAHDDLFITTRCDKTSGAKDARSILDEIYKQLAMYRLEYEYKDDKPFAKPRQIITGKAPQRKDDLAFALSMSVHWNYATRTEEEFLTLAESRGLILG